MPVRLVAIDLDGTLLRSAGRKTRLIETQVAVELVHGLRERLPGILFAVEYEAFAHEAGFSAWDWTPPPGRASRTQSSCSTIPRPS